MSNEALQVLSAALALPDRERAELAGRLLESLDPEADAEAEALWEQEVRRRIDARNRGQVRMVPWDQVRQRMTGADDATSSS